MCMLSDEIIRQVKGSPLSLHKLRPVLIFSLECFGIHQAKHINDGSCKLSILVVYMLMMVSGPSKGRRCMNDLLRLNRWKLHDVDWQNM